MILTCVVAIDYDMDEPVNNKKVGNIMSSNWKIKVITMTFKMIWVIDSDEGSDMSD